MKSKILIVANSTWNIYNFRLNVIDKFLAEGFDISVLAPIDRYLEYKKKYPQVHHYTIRNLNRDGTNPLQDLILVMELARKYRSLSPDVIVHYTNKPNIYGAFAAKMIGIKSIGIVTGLGYPFIRKGWIRHITSYLYKVSSKYHKRLIFENIADRELFENENIIPKGKGISIKGCGVNMEHYSPRNYNNSNGKTVFTFIGRLLYDKGIREFVDAAKHLTSSREDVEFWIVGQLDNKNPATIDKNDLERWVNSKTIKYFGFQQDVRDIIANSDCIVLPSYREAIPRTITEGMSMAKPVITSDTAGCVEAVDVGENGFLVPIKDSEALIQTMEKFIQLPNEKKIEMGQTGRLKAEKEFDDRIIANQIFQITQKVLNEA